MGRSSPGDLNAYAMEDPVAAIKAASYTNLTESYIGASAYSYGFEGQFGYLDHVLGNTSLVPQVTGVTEWHINVRPLDGSTSRVRWTTTTTTSRGCTARTSIGRRTTIRRLWG